MRAIEKIEAMSIPFSSKVAVEREDFEHLSTLAKKYVAAEKKESKLQKALDAANRLIARLKEEIAGLKQEKEGDIGAESICTGIGNIQNTHDSVYQRSAHRRQCVYATDHDAVDDLLKKHETPPAVMAKRIRKGRLRHWQPAPSAQTPSSYLSGGVIMAGSLISP